MAVDRLSVTVPAELGAALRELAERRGQTVSTIVTEAIAHQVRLAALERALAADERELGPVAEKLVEQAATELGRAAKQRRGRRKA